MAELSHWSRITKYDKILIVWGWSYHICTVASCDQSDKGNLSSSQK